MTLRKHSRERLRLNRGDSMQDIDLRTLTLDRLIAQLSSSKGLAIAGAGCTGKSTLALELAARLRSTGVEATVLELDGYFMSREERARAGISAYHPDAFDLRQARHDIDLLLDGQGVAVRTYDKVTGTRRDAGVLKLADCLIIEGAMALREPVAGISSFRVFLDASLDTLFRNRQRRERALGFDDESIKRKFEGLKTDYATHVVPQCRSAHLCIEVDDQYRFTKLETRYS